jgi:hypothetical protein
MLCSGYGGVCEKTKKQNWKKKEIKMVHPLINNNNNERM